MLTSAHQRLFLPPRLRITGVQESFANTSPITMLYPPKKKGTLLLAFIEGMTSSGTNAVNTPTGFTSLATLSATGAFVPGMRVAYKLCDGTEGNSVSVAMGGGTTNNMASLVFAIEGWVNGKAINAATPVAVGTGTSMDVGAATLSNQGGNDTLWIACCIYTNTVTNTTQFPIGFAPQARRVNETFPHYYEYAVRRDNVRSINPSAWTIAAAAYGVTSLVGIST